MGAEPISLMHDIADLTREELLRIAVARGCRHYAPLLAADIRVVDEPSVVHEILGAALLRGPADAATFQTIRCGAMVLSDLGNSLPLIAEACAQLNVTDRVAHIARLGLVGDEHPDFWNELLRLLPPVSGREVFLPGLSRLTSECRRTETGGTVVRRWLRTCYAR